MLGPPPQLLFLLPSACLEGQLSRVEAHFFAIYGNRSGEWGQSNSNDIGAWFSRFHR